MAPDQHLSVVEARREYTNPHLAQSGGRQGSVDDLQRLGITEAPDLNNSIAGLNHKRSPCVLVVQSKDRQSSAHFADLSPRRQEYGQPEILP